MALADAQRIIRRLRHGEDIFSIADALGVTPADIHGVLRDPEGSAALPAPSFGGGGGGGGGSIGNVFVVDEGDVLLDPSSFATPVNLGAPLTVQAGHIYALSCYVQAAAVSDAVTLEVSLEGDGYIHGTGDLATNPDILSAFGPAGPLEAMNEDTLVARSDGTMQVKARISDTNTGNAPTEAQSYDWIKIVLTDLTTSMSGEASSVSTHFNLANPPAGWDFTPGVVNSPDPEKDYLVVVTANINTGPGAGQGINWAYLQAFVGFYLVGAVGTQDPTTAMTGSMAFMVPAGGLNWKLDTYLGGDGTATINEVHVYELQTIVSGGGGVVGVPGPKGDPGPAGTSPRIAPDTSVFHAVDSVAASSLPGFSGGYMTAAAGEVDLRRDLVFDPPLDDNTGYYVELVWAADTSEDGVAVRTTDIAQNFSAMGLFSDVGPTPAGGLPATVYMAPGNTVILEAQGPSGKWIPPNCWGVR